jgi:hypothetical protein
MGKGADYVAVFDFKHSFFYTLGPPNRILPATGWTKTILAAMKNFGDLSTFATGIDIDA